MKALGPALEGRVLEVKVLGVIVRVFSAYTPTDIDIKKSKSTF
jgi:hypothetical protein